jgi:hypothetical protein
VPSAGAQHGSRRVISAFNSSRFIWSTVFGRGFTAISRSGAFTPAM